MRTFHNIYKLQKHVLLRHQSYLIVLWVTKFTILGDNAPLNLNDTLPRQLTPPDTYIVYMYIPTYMYNVHYIKMYDAHLVF